MFEGRRPDGFSWYVKSHGIDVDPVVDHSQIVQLVRLQAGLGGPHDPARVLCELGCGG
jgi:phosphosulfolactate synthase (CoM biosynthesis protein A)